ncbi:MAG: HAMP domain-containing histidine kinase [Thermoanaerobaculia bacterium]|nr:HAMP domain-containing histidine kinase [Thermoanaerobaculia bacterium]
MSAGGPVPPFAPGRREAEVLDLVNRKVAAGRSLEEVLDFLFRATRDVCPCDRLGVAFLEEGGQRVVARRAVADYEPLLLSAGWAEDLAATSLGPVLEGEEPRILGDLPAYLEARPTSRSTRLLVDEGVRSSLAARLVVEGRVLGFLFRSSRRRHAYDARQAGLHLAVGERLAQAVEKAWLLDRLAEANAGYLEMLGFVSHELKAPLASLAMDGETLLGGYAGSVDDVARAAIERMTRKAAYLGRLVKEYLDLARVEQRDLAVRRVACDLLADVVEPALDVVLPVLGDRGCPLVRDVPPAPVGAVVDPELMTVVLVNLLGNAAKYAREGGEVKLSVRRDGPSVRVAVRNEGPGFRPEERARLFRRFSRLSDPELAGRPGSGVGLYTCWRIVRLHGGRIEALSEPGRWAEFRFEVPAEG